MHFSVLVLTDRADVTRDNAAEEAERLLQPFQEEYDEDSEELTGHWDWWVVGGRWTGALSGSKPSSDQANYETCVLCAGTGTRPDAERFGQAWIEWSHGCNGCFGKGFAEKWPSHYEPHEGDVIPVEALKGDWPSRIAAVVTPAGEWFGGLMSDFPKDEIRRIVNDHQEATAIVVDCHV